MSSFMHLAKIALSYLFLNNWHKNFNIFNCNHNCRKKLHLFSAYEITYVLILPIQFLVSIKLQEKILHFVNHLKYNIEQFICISGNVFIK